PSWKAIFEVYDADRLEQTFERVIDEVNKVAAKAGKPALTIDRELVGGKVFYAIKQQGTPIEFHYTFTNGYMIAAASRALLDNALRYRESGYTLLRSQRFISALPEDGNANFSAVFYHDLSPLIGPLAQVAAGQLSGEQAKAVKSLAESGPTVACAYAYG